MAAANKKEESAAAVSAVASALMHSDLEAQLKAKLAKSEALAGGDKKKVTRQVKKVRLTPGKVLSMAIGDHNKSRTQESPDMGPSTDEIPKKGKRKEQKKEVKDALFGPGKLNPKLRKRGSSTDNEGPAKEKKPRRRRRKMEPPPPPKEHTPPSPEPKSPPKDPSPPPPTEEEPPPEEPTSPPPEDPPPKEPTPPPPPPPPPPKKKSTPPPPPPKEPTPPAEEKEEEPAPPAQDEAPDDTNHEAAAMESDEEIVPEEAVFKPVKQVARKSRRHNACTPSFSSLCCSQSRYGSTLTGRLKWLMVLIYRGPICYLWRRTLEKASFPPLVLGPTFDSILIEYLNLLLDAADALLLSIYPELKFEKVDLVQEKDTDEEENEG